MSWLADAKGLMQSRVSANPGILEVEEMQKRLPARSVRERAMVLLDMPSALLRGELAGLQWRGSDFKNLYVGVTRSQVNQHVRTR